MKIITIIGARPQFIKAANLSREIAKYEEIEEILIHTGQHYDDNMSNIFFDEMQIPKPKYNLGIGGSSNGEMTGQMIEKIEQVCLIEKPNILLVYGDTNSTLAGAIVASKMDVKLVHVEAGLRSYNMKMPEEINRILTDRVSDVLLCPTITAVNNLKIEGFENYDCKISNVGDIMYDGALFYSNLSKPPKNTIDSEFYLVTVHRAENTNDFSKLKSIIETLNKLSSEKTIIFPIHPRTKKKIKEFNLKLAFETIDPVGYLEMVWLIKNSKLVITDSGGLQKEAFFFGKPCVTLREETEWSELVDSGYNLLAGHSEDKIRNAVNTLKDKEIVNTSLYGDGRTASKIINLLLELKAEY